jgi:methionyl-tRNA formyltransferase
MARVVFMGTPGFAVPSLEALLESQEVVGVVAQPDRRAGRGRSVQFSPVKEAALAGNVSVYQPRSVSAPKALERLRAWKPDVIVVAAYGQILSEDVLQVVDGRAVNVHASLLPRWRGAAPVAAAILAGDASAGVTIMEMVRALDAGPIVAQEATPIRADDTRATLQSRLAELGARLLVDTLPGYLEGDIAPRSQAGGQVTYAPQLRKEHGCLCWTKPAVDLDRQVRAFTPWPGAFTVWQGKRLKILRATE